MRPHSIGGFVLPFGRPAPMYVQNPLLHSTNLIKKSSKFTQNKQFRRILVRTDVSLDSLSLESSSLKYFALRFMISILKPRFFAIWYKISTPGIRSFALRIRFFALRVRSFAMLSEFLVDASINVQIFFFKWKWVDLDLVRFTLFSLCALCANSRVSPKDPQNPRANRCLRLAQFLLFPSSLSLCVFFC